MRCDPQASPSRATDEIGPGVAGMAGARRRAGLLRDTILHVMRDGRPMRAVHIREAVAREGLAVPASLFFRDLGKLVQRGAIRKIHAARSYAIIGPEPRILLHCRVCCGLAEVDCEAVFAGIADLGARYGFSISRSIVEVSGVCSCCSARCHELAAP